MHQHVRCRRSAAWISGPRSKSLHVLADYTYVYGIQREVIIVKKVFDYTSIQNLGIGDPRKGTHKPRQWNECRCRVRGTGRGGSTEATTFLCATRPPSAKRPGKSQSGWRTEATRRAPSRERPAWTSWKSFSGGSTLGG